MVAQCRKLPRRGRARKKWNTFKPHNGDNAITIGSIFYHAQQGGWDGASPRRTNLPIIQITDGELPRMVNEAEAALLKADAKLYKQGGRIVRIIWDRGKTCGGAPTSVLRLSPVEAPHLMERLAGVAYWQKRDARTKKQMHKDVPRNVVDSYLARDGEWELPSLLGVVTAPTLRPDGTILDQPGYDEATGLVYHPRGVVFPPVPENPSREDALRALTLLKQPFREFPFVPGAHLAVALSDIITTLIRRSLPVAPMHAYSSPEAGTGKSLAVDIACIIGTGERAAVTTVVSDRYFDAELKKCLEACFLAGDAVISIDNLTQPIRGEALCSMITQPQLKVRPLGETRSVIVPNVFSFHATGNNLTVESDATRRVLVSQMDAGVERPEMRKFSFDVLDYTREQRGTLVVAALTVVRAYLASGEKQQEAPLGGFEDWSRLVRDPLIWLGEPDPVAVTEETRGGDPDLTSLKAVMAAWLKTLGVQSKGVLVRT